MATCIGLSFYKIKLWMAMYLNVHTEYIMYFSISISKTVMGCNRTYLIHVDGNMLRVNHFISYQVFE